MSNQRITSTYMSTYEITKIIGERAMQLENGSEPFVEVKYGEIDNIAIAERELKEGKLDMIIRRILPSGNSEDWLVSELKIAN